MAAVMVQSAMFWRVIALLGALGTLLAGEATAGYAIAQGVAGWARIVPLAALGLLWPVTRAFGREANARLELLRARHHAALTLGWALPLWLAMGVAWFVTANQFSVGGTFFDLALIGTSFPLVVKAFATNIEIFVIAEPLILAWGLMIALLRLLPGEAAKPVRALAVLYADLFRALPTIVVVYLIAFGLPLTGLAVFANASPIALAILALTLNYGAYEAEIFRAGVESVHRSQVAAARSLGLSYGQTMRFVVLPQAIRRIIPPLLNDFISLQKDTALLSIVGTIEAFNQAKMIANNHFNLSAVTCVAALFVLITIPQARFVDRLIDRDRARTQAGG